ncbi:MAG: hypothetical protein R6V85_04160 [Polyangia bacterium]
MSKPQPFACDGTGREQSGAAGLDWSFVDAAFCISLREREDRRLAVRRQLESAGLAERTELVIVDKHPENPEQGIFESHIRCIEKGLAAGAERMLILEDDIAFCGLTPERLAACARFVSTDQRWGAFFFGCLARWAWSTGFESVLRVSHACLTHAYVLNRWFAERLVAQRWKGAPFDKVLGALGSPMYAVYPSFAFQSDTPSDNVNCKAIAVRSRLGGLAGIQRANEIFLRYRYFVIAAHLLLMAVISLLVFG